MPQTYVNLHSFAGNYGSTPQAGLLLNDKTLYGTTFAGGSSSNGTVFAVNTDGSDFTNLYRFSNLTTITNQVVIPPGTITFTEYSYTNSDGANPEAALVLSGQTLYGTTSAGGSGGWVPCLLSTPMASVLPTSILFRAATGHPRPPV